MLGQPLAPQVGPPAGRETRIRTLGWDGLDVTVEELIAAIGDALAKLDFTYDVDTKEAAVFLPGNDQRACADEDQLVVHFLVQQSEGGLLNLDVRRLRGDSFRFHSLYRDFRQAMSAINGWDECAGEYSVAQRQQRRKLSAGADNAHDEKPSPMDVSGAGLRALDGGDDCVPAPHRSPMGLRVGSVASFLDKYDEC